MPNYEIVRTTVAAAYAALPVSARPSASYNLESYTLMLIELAEYERHGKIGPAIYVTSQCKVFDMESALNRINALNEAPAAPAVP